MTKLMLVQASRETLPEVSAMDAAALGIFSLMSLFLTGESGLARKLKPASVVHIARVGAGIWRKDRQARRRIHLLRTASAARSSSVLSSHCLTFPLFSN